MSGGALSVVMVSASFHPHVGGAESQALELSGALLERGLSVRVVTRRLPGLPARELVRGVPVERLWRAGGGVLDAATFFVSLCAWLVRERRSYQVVHAHLAGSPAAAAALMGRLLGKRVFVKLGGGAGIGELAVSSRTPAGRLKLALFRALKPTLLVVARPLAQEAARYLGAMPVQTLPNGVDAARYAPLGDPARREAARARLGWPTKGLVFLYTGRLSPEKRLPHFVEIWARETKKARGTFTLAMIGAGSEEPAIRSSIEFARAADRVKILPPMASVAEAYAAADVFVLPSVSEGLSNALLEAMASGLAVLATRVGGTPEAVEDGVSGFLYDSGNEEQLKAQLGKLLERPELALVMGRAARERALAAFSLDKTAERCELLYRHG